MKPLFPIACVLTFLVPRALALETDQFTTANQTLADITREFEQHSMGQIREIVDHTNKSIDAKLKEADTTRSVHRRQRCLFLAHRLMQPKHIAAEVDRRFGRGLTKTSIEHWFEKHEFDQQPALHTISYRESVYAGSAHRWPFMVFAMAPTVKIHGVRMGTDKVGHFFQQGHDYYRNHNESFERTGNAKTAAAHAVSRGARQERTHFGDWITGIYSNADMAANFAGMKFYLNLTSEIEIGNTRCAPILFMRDGQWHINESRCKSLLKPFFSEHFDESLNSALYQPLMRKTVCASLASRANKLSDRQQESARLQSMAHWHGEDYGHSGLDGLITSADIAQASTTHRPQLLEQLNSFVTRNTVPFLKSTTARD